MKTQHSIPDTQLYIFMPDMSHFYDKEKPESRSKKNVKKSMKKCPIP